MPIGVYLRDRKGGEMRKGVAVRLLKGGKALNVISNDSKPAMAFKSHTSTCKACKGGSLCKEGVMLKQSVLEYSRMQKQDLAEYTTKQLGEQATAPGYGTMSNMAKVLSQSESERLAEVFRKARSKDPRQMSLFPGPGKKGAEGRHAGPVSGGGAEGRVKRHLRQVGGKPVPVQEHRRKKKPARVKVSKKLTRTPAAATPPSGGGPMTRRQEIEARVQGIVDTLPEWLAKRPRRFFEISMGLGRSGQAMLQGKIKKLVNQGKLTTTTIDGTRAYLWGSPDEKPYRPSRDVTGYEGYNVDDTGYIVEIERQGPAGWRSVATRPETARRGTDIGADFVHYDTSANEARKAAMDWARADAKKKPTWPKVLGAEHRGQLEKVAAGGEHGHTHGESAELHRMQHLEAHGLLIGRTREGEDRPTFIVTPLGKKHLGAPRELGKAGKYAEPKEPTGAGQKGLMTALRGWGGVGEVTLLSTHAALRGVHFKQILSAAKQLDKKGLAKLEGNRLTIVSVVTEEKPVVPAKRVLAEVKKVRKNAHKQIEKHVTGKKLGLRYSLDNQFRAEEFELNAENQKSIMNSVKSGSAEMRLQPHGHVQVQYHANLWYELHDSKATRAAVDVALGRKKAPPPRPAGPGHRPALGAL